MSVSQSPQDSKLLSRTNSELKHALRHFIESAPNSGPLAVKIDAIKSALNSNEAIFTFASLVEQYAKMKQNFDNVDYQNKKKDLKTLKALLKKSANKNLSSIQNEKIDDIMSAISLNQEDHAIMVAVGKALAYFSEDLGALRKASEVIVSETEVQTEETGVKATDVHLASKRLLKDVIIISRQLTKTYPNDKIISSVLDDAEQISNDKGFFFKTISIVERSTTYLALLIQQERCAAEEMLNDIHANIVDAFKHTSVIENLLNSTKDNANDVKASMVCQLKNMEVKAKSIDTIEGMQKHIKDNVFLMSSIMNDYAETQNQIHLNNESTISDLSYKVSTTANFVEELESKLNIAEESILVDELTTIGNRKGYVEAINKERKTWSTSKLPLTLMLVDADKFKRINDTFGHNVGDQVLKCIGQTLKKQIRSTDYVARYGGEEFVIIMPATDLKEAVLLAKKIKKVINSLKFELRTKDKVLSITCSFGLATFTERRSNTTDVFIAADKALYKAKENGRNTIVVSSEEKFIYLDKKKLPS
jgi:diguanylate cyclase (GGDEF)-like protein